MKQYTTPIETLIIPTNISVGYDLWVYFACGNEYVEKTNDELSISEEDGKTKIELSLTQAETGKLANGVIKVEVTWKHRASGKVGKTATAVINGIQSLRKGEV